MANVFWISGWDIHSMNSHAWSCFCDAELMHRSQPPRHANLWSPRLVVGSWATPTHSGLSSDPAALPPVAIAYPYGQLRWNTASPVMNTVSDSVSLYVATATGA